MKKLIFGIVLSLSCLSLKAQASTYEFKITVSNQDTILTSCLDSDLYKEVFHIPGELINGSLSTSSQFDRVKHTPNWWEHGCFLINVNRLMDSEIIELLCIATILEPNQIILVEGF